MKQRRRPLGPCVWGGNLLTNHSQGGAAQDSTDDHVKCGYKPKTSKNIQVFAFSPTIHFSTASCEWPFDGCGLMMVNVYTAEHDTFSKWLWSPLNWCVVFCEIVIKWSGISSWVCIQEISRSYAGSNTSKYPQMHLTVALTFGIIFTQSDCWPVDFSVTPLNPHRWWVSKAFGVLCWCC